MNGDEKKLADLLENVLSRAKSREPAKNAVAQLFPRAEAGLRTYVPRDSGARGERKRQHRISEKDFALAYFRLDPQPATWSRSEIDLVLNSPDPFKALGDVQERVNGAREGERPRLRRLFLEALDGSFNVRRPLSLAWLRALLEFAPSFVAAVDESTVFLYTFDNADRLRWIIIHAFEGLLPENRAALMLAVIPETKDVSILCDVVRTIVRDQHAKGAGDERSSAGFDESTDAVRDVLLDRVRSLAQSNQIWAQSQPDRILWFWWGCDLEAEVREFTTRAMNTDEGIRGLLNATVTLVHSTEGNYEHVAVSSWSKIIDLDRLASYASAWRSRSNESDRGLAERFLKALEEGKKRPI
jgi:hypothetical protein